MADSYPVLLKKAIAADLAAADLAVYKPVGAYTKTDTATLPGVMTNGPDLPTTVDRCLVLTTLTPFDDGPHNRVTPVQFRTRLPGGRSDAENQFENIRDRYHGRRQITLGQLTFRLIQNVSSLFISPDESGRSGYFITFHFYGRRVV